jgi:ketosteroid isomerase-like protein
MSVTEAFDRLQRGGGIQRVREWLDVTANGPAEAWHERAVDDVVIRLPFAPPGVANELRGLSQAIAAMTPMWNGKKSFIWHDVVIRGTDDPGLFVTTARSEVLLLSGQHYANSYVILTRLQDARVVEHVEYFNPLPVIEVFGNQLRPS